MTDYGQVRSIELGKSPFGKPLMTTRLYLVDGVLFDTGLSHNRKEVLEFIDRNTVSSVYLTHHHEDHSGNAAAVNRRFGISIFGHPVTVEKMRNPLPIFLYQHYMWGAAEAAHLNPIPEKIESNRFTFIPVHTPGHARDHTVYLEPDQGWLFSGDLYLADRIRYFRADECFHDQVESLRKVLKLDFDTLFCSHNPKLKNGKQHLRNKLNFLLEIREKVKFLLDKGRNPKEIIREVGLRESRLIRVMCGGNVKSDFIVLSAIESLTGDHPSGDRR